jgi:hypothetical protein
MNDTACRSAAVRLCQIDEGTETTAPDIKGINWADHLARFRETEIWLSALEPRPAASAMATGASNVG